jgi:hypothetical protein
VKTQTLNTIQTVAGFFLIGALPYGVHAGSFLLFVVGCAGFALFMGGLLKEEVK